MAEPTAEAGTDRTSGAEDDLRGLFAELADGRVAALEPLYDALADEVHALALWRTGSASDAADVLQGVFVKLAEARGALRRVRDPRAYVRTMAHRAAVDVHRRRSRRAEDPLEALPLLEAEPAAPERRVDAERVSALLLQLPAEQREALYLRVHAGCTHAEVGRATGVPTFTAASRCRLALRRLRELMGLES
jgi:RNA polymerase sigma-70 factor (ECF subfamily)